jgi:ElaB/YqjD/DUF883 family membrane-anchored ribosome-binding protein
LVGVGKRAGRASRACGGACGELFPGSDKGAVRAQRQGPPDDPSLALNELRKRLNRVRADVQNVTSESNSPSPALAMADKIVDPVEDALGERPIATIALGFGLGFLLGLVWGRG